jgi:hypothetical protein
MAHQGSDISENPALVRHPMLQVADVTITVHQLQEILRRDTSDFRSKYRDRILDYSEQM